MFFGSVLISFTAYSVADDFEWTGAAANGTWNDSDNWAGGGNDADGIPDDNDNASFNVDASISGSGASLSLSVGPNVAVTLAGVLNVGDGTSGTITNEGTLIFDAGGPSVTRRLGIVGDVILEGGGEIVLTESFSQILQQTTDATLTNIDNTIRGTGLIQVPLNNESLIRSEGGVLRISRVVTNTDGNVEVASDGVLQTAGGSIVGGNVLGEAGSGIQGGEGADGDFQGLTLAGEHTIVTTTTLTLAGTITNEGTLIFEDTGASAVRRLGVVGDVILEGGGEIVLTESTSQMLQLTTDATLTNVDNTIRGTGIVSVEILNTGTLFADSPVGDLDFVSEVTLASVGQMSIRLDGPGFVDSGFFDFTTDPELAGTLDLVVSETFDAAIGDNYKCLEANNLNGSEFEQIDSTMAENASVRYVFDIVYGVDSVSVVVLARTLLGDANGDDNVDLLDVGVFVQILSEGDFLEEADINGDGVVDLLDVAPFVALLAGG